MARTSHSNRIATRTKRLELPIRREPYWHSIEAGFALGYRRLAGNKGGTWIAKRYVNGERRVLKALGTADDFTDADGVRALTFAQAQAGARQWLGELARAKAGGVDLSKPYTVGNALDDYLIDYVTEGGRAEIATRRVIDNLIRPAVGSIPLVKLTFAQVKGFRDGLQQIGRRFRTKKGAPHQPEKLRANDIEQRRKRRATANRVFTFLRAALNLAYESQKITTDAAWASIKPFGNVDAPRERYLTDDEAVRLANACAPDMRALVTAALLTGCRYGELIAMRAGHFDGDNGTLHIPESKSGKRRDVVLASEGRQFFEASTMGKGAAELVFRRAGGNAWKRVDQVRPLKSACSVARIFPAVGFHILRHTYASRLARANVPIVVIAKQLGHADLRMTTRHYAHLSPGYVADTVRAAFGSMGLVATQFDNMSSINEARAKSTPSGDVEKLVKVGNNR